MTNERVSKSLSVANDGNMLNFSCATPVTVISSAILSQITMHLISYSLELRHPIVVAYSELPRSRGYKCAVTGDLLYLISLGKWGKMEDAMMQAHDIAHSNLEVRV